LAGEHGANPKIRLRHYADGHCGALETGADLNFDFVPVGLPNTSTGVAMGLVRRERGRFDWMGNTFNRPGAKDGLVY